MLSLDGNSECVYSLPVISWDPWSAGHGNRMHVHCLPECKSTLAQETGIGGLKTLDLFCWGPLPCFPMAFSLHREPFVLYEVPCKCSELTFLWEWKDSILFSGGMIGPFSLERYVVWCLHVCSHCCSPAGCMAHIVAVAKGEAAAWYLCDSIRSVARH